MTAPITVAVAQPRCVPHDVRANAAAHADAVRRAQARVVVFPELSLTGYELDAAAVRVDDERLLPIVEACARTGAVALVGAPVDGEAGRAHIAMLAVDGDGARVVYRKLWVADTEAERFAPGDGPAAVTVDGHKLGLAICKDTSVAQHAADTAALGIDAYLAGTVMLADEAALQDERAARRAAEHGVAVAVASFAGPTGGGYDETAGGSGIWDADGTLLDQVGPEPGAIARATLRARRPARAVHAGPRGLRSRVGS